MFSAPLWSRPRGAAWRRALTIAWTSGSHTELVGTLELACRVGKIIRSLTWDRYLRVQGYDQAGEFSGAPLKCLVPLLEESYVGGA